MEQTGGNVEYRVMMPGDTTQVKRLLMDSFFKDEPLCISLNFEVPEESAFHVDDLVEAASKDKISIIAVDSRSGEIIGCRLSTIDTKTAQWVPTVDRENPIHRKIVVIEDFMKALYGDIDLFSRYSVETMLSFLAVSVVATHRGRRIATKMVEKSIELAKKRGIRAVKVVASNHITIKLFEKMGFEKIKEILYKDYRGDDGEIVFKNTGDSTRSALFVKILD